MRPFLSAVAALLLALGAAASAQSSDTIRASGLTRPVEMIRDHWGIAHIYASNEHDLFFAQGYSAASDRLFQFELWRRQATGTVAELLGPREVQRDIGARLFKFRGSMTQELSRYHPHGPAIIRAFVEGVNAYIAETERDPRLLPAEFQLLHTKPGRWTPEVVISRHGGLLGNIEEELTLTRAVAAIGPAKVKELWSFHPGDPDLTIDPAIDRKLLNAPILALYQAYRAPVRFQPTDLIASARNDEASYRRLAAAADSAYTDIQVNQRRDIGSNNWVVSGKLAINGQPMMANDPHRAQSAPSLRYWVHLVAPGWNVIGGGEPEIPGISIGHNEQGAWGLTIFSTDGEDLYVYKTNPADPDQYRYAGKWESMRTVRETIPVKGAAPVTARLKYTRHGPVVFEDTAEHVAYAVRAAWLEPGSAPYLASLRMDQAKTWDEFREACTYSYIPGENMVWADRAGHIGWQSVGIAPIRSHWSGLVAVPGDGRYEWGGYLPIKEKPHSFDPPEGFIATANNDLIPPGYAHMDAVGFVWADPYRWARISEVLGAGRKLGIADMERLQTDYLSLPARQLVPFLRGLNLANMAVADRARNTLLAWNYVLDANSRAAALYERWYSHLVEDLSHAVIPETARPYIRALSTARIIDIVASPPGSLGVNPLATRDSIMAQALKKATNDLINTFGTDTMKWVYGDSASHHALIIHPLASVSSQQWRARLNVGPAPRGGDGNTVGATGNGGNQTSGASFRIATDVGDWERTVGINAPGQSGDPENPHYRDLFELWANDQYFPVPYAKARVQAVAEKTWVLAPGR